MREIKFRMWNNVKHDNSKSKYFYDVETVIECLKQQINFNNGKSVRFEHTCYDHLGDGCFFEQFTGLTDKNGKEIYEGDICRIGKHGLFKIVWSELRAMFEMEWIDAIHRNVRVISEEIFQNHKLMFEVIGNIHENSDLL